MRHRQKQLLRHPAAILCEQGFGINLYASRICGYHPSHERGQPAASTAATIFSAWPVTEPILHPRDAGYPDFVPERRPLALMDRIHAQGGFIEVSRVRLGDGAKVKTTLGSGFDVTLYDYFHRNEMPSPELTPTAANPESGVGAASAPPLQDLGFTSVKRCLFLEKGPATVHFAARGPDSTLTAGCRP